jgi:hypothetical protein
VACGRNDALPLVVLLLPMLPMLVAVPAAATVVMDVAAADDAVCMKPRDKASTDT